jgi:hypothetical protein
VQQRLRAADISADAVERITAVLDRGDVEVQVGEGAHVDLHELPARLSAGHRRGDRIALKDVLLVE